MSAAPPSTAAALERLQEPLARRVRTGGGLAAVGGALVVAGVIGLLVRAGVIRTPGWVIGAWAGVVIATVVAFWWAHRAGRGLRVRAIADYLEREGGFRRGALNSVLDGQSTGTSTDLFGAADASYAQELSDRGRTALGGLRLRVSRQVQLTVGLFGAGVLLFGAARPTRAPVNLLWRPGAAWSALVAPVTLSVDQPIVDRGAVATVRVAALGRRDAVLWTRAKGEGWQSAPVALDSVGVALKRLGPLTGDLFAFATTGGQSSDTIAIRVRLPAFLGSLTLTAKYPAYLHLDDEPLPTGGDTLLLPVGTRLQTRGEATAPLSSVRWEIGGSGTPLTVTGAAFQGDFTPAASGVLTLRLTTADGASLGTEPIRVPLRIVPDTPPEVEVPVPGSDTVFATAATVPLVLDVRDDHAVTAVAIVARRTTRQGRAEPPVQIGVPMPNGPTDRVMLSAALDVKGLGLEPGDTLHYVVTAWDNTPAGQTGRSRDLVIIIPTATEARSEQRDRAGAVAKGLDSLVAEAKRLQRQTEDLSRERQRPSAGSGERQEPALSFDEAKKAEAIAKSQQEMMEQANAVKEQLRQLEESAEQSGMADSAFRKQLEEVRDQLSKALSPELKKKLEELQQALKNLDPQSAKDALKKLADAQQQLKEALERSRELFKRAALEGELSSLEHEAKDVLEDQQKWNQQVATTDSARAAAAEQQLAARTDSLAQGLNSAAKQLENQERKDQLQQAAQQAKQAASQMRQAAESAKKGQSKNAKQQGEQAAQQLESVPKDVKEQREKQQDEWKEEVLRALDRALAETTRLSQRQLAVSKAFARGASISTIRTEQGAIEEGTQKLVEQINAVSGKNALVSPQIGAALMAARLQMARAREAVSSASANLREAAEQAGDAVDALNVAAYQMLRSRGDVSGAASASGVSEAMERMTQLANQQGSMSQEGNTLLSMAGQQMQQQLQSLAAKQRAMAEELERLRAQSQMSAAKELADEARELARKLESGRLDRETVERQERLFRRMLDAGRTLQGHEEDEKKERQSTVAKGDSISLPPGLSAKLLGKHGEIRLPSWDELQQLSPEERRLVADYFRRLTTSGTPR